MKKLKYPVLLVLQFLIISSLHAQMITGVWKGRINHQKVEVKIIQKGDNLAGTSYYYESPDNYRRYSIKGYFDPVTNEAVWWDDELLEEKTGRLSSPGKIPLLSRADFNCPGDGRMMLDGKASRVDDEKKETGVVDLDKTNRTIFSDEWDFVIENYTVGANDPEIIDSIGLIAVAKRPVVEEILNNKKAAGHGEPAIADIPKPDVAIEPAIPIVVQETKMQIPLSIEEKFKTRKKIFAAEIPVSGDSIELRFYDNAQIDGDSISLFLNERLIFQHIRLTEKAYIVNLPVSALNSSNELIMVAENLGSIPPNTSYMVAIVGDKKYEARLESTEGSSAMIRLVRKN